MYSTLANTLERQAEEAYRYAEELRLQGHPREAVAQERHAENLWQSAMELRYNVQ